MGTLDTAHRNSGAAARLVDINNCILIRFYGTGTSGRRITKVISGVMTDSSTSQGVQGEWLRAVCSGTDVDFDEAGTGSTPGTWNSVWSGTIDEAAINSETSQGIIVGDALSTDAWLDEFRAEAAGAGGADLTATPADTNALSWSDTPGGLLTFAAQVADDVNA